MDGFNRKVVKIGTITVLCAIVANFLPVLYLWIVYGEIPTGSQLASILSMIFAASAVSWIVQPLSYYGGLGMVGTYISWISGSAADIRLPSINMAQKVTNTEASSGASWAGKPRRRRAGSMACPGLSRARSSLIYKRCRVASSAGVLRSGGGRRYVGCLRYFLCPVLF